MNVLLVGGHPSLLKPLRQGLEEEGFAVDVAEDGEVGNSTVPTKVYDVILLDLLQAKEERLALLRTWRTSGLRTPILVLTAPNGSGGRVEDIYPGASDGLLVPFELEELLGRVRFLARSGARP
jgi:DNA-binding response OmpR family regulator